MRDAKLGEIGERTSEVQRIVIARALLRGGGLASLWQPGRRDRPARRRAPKFA